MFSFVPYRCLHPKSAYLPFDCTHSKRALEYTILLMISSKRIVTRSSPLRVQTVKLAISNCPLPFAPSKNQIYPQSTWKLSLANQCIRVRETKLPSPPNTQWPQSNNLQPETGFSLILCMSLFLLTDPTSWLYPRLYFSPGDKILSFYQLCVNNLYIVTEMILHNPDRI